MCRQYDTDKPPRSFAHNICWTLEQLLALRFILDLWHTFTYILNIKLHLDRWLILSNSNCHQLSPTLSSPCVHPVFTLCSPCLHPVFTLYSPCLHLVFTLLLGSIFCVLFWVVYRAIFRMISRSVFHPAEWTTYVLLPFQGFTLGTSWLLTS